MDEFTVTGGQVLGLLAVLLIVVLVAVAGRVLLAAAVIAGVQWAVITYWSGNTTLVWVVLGVPALLAGYTLADALPSATTAWVLIVFGAATAGIGMAMLWAAAHTKQRRPGAARPPAGRVAAMTCTSVSCGVITGGQWALLSQIGPGPGWIATLCLPAFLAAATVTRLLAVVRIVGRRRSARVVRRGRRSHR